MGRPVVFPAVSANIPELGVGLALKKGAHVPAWIATAVAPYASIQDIQWQKNSQAKTVLLYQDLHLHTEAQLNIAGAINAIANATKDASQDDRLLVAMEGAEAKKIDVSEYAALDQSILRPTAEGLARVSVLNGAELAAIGYGATVDLMGIETAEDYQTHVKTILEARSHKDQAEKDLAQAMAQLALRKKKVLNSDLAQFDSSRTAYNNGTLSLPAYALYLDSIVSAQTSTLRNLIAASLLEGSIDFRKVETERAEMIRLLAEKCSDQEIQRLTQFSVLFRSGQLTYTAYYNLIKSLAETHGVALQRYPEMNLYVQYVLKSEAIDHAQLFQDIKLLESQVSDTLGGTAEEKELLVQSRALGLAKKLVEFTLTEDEWAEYKNTSPNPSIAQHGGEFEAFYAAAERRNNSISENLANQFHSSPSHYAVLVAGGFHSRALLKNLKAQGFNTILLSPKITKMQEGLSSVDVLASGRLPLDRLFAGEKLFIPTPPATSTQAGLISNVIHAAVQAGGTLLRQGARLASATVGQVTATASRSPNQSGFAVSDPNGGEYSIALNGGAFQGAYFLKPFSWPKALARYLINSPRQRKEVLETFIHFFMGAYRRDGNTLPVQNAAQRGKNIFEDEKKRHNWIRDVSAALPHFSDLLNLFWNGLPLYVDKRFIDDLHEILSPLMITNKGGLMVPAIKTALEFFHYRDPRLEVTIKDRIKKVRRALGLSDDITIKVVLLDGKGLKTYAQVVRSADTPTHYFLRVSREFLDRFVFDHNMLEEVMVLGGLPVDRAQNWLIDRFLAHEFAEAFLRKRYDITSLDRNAQGNMHGLLSRNGFGWSLTSFDGVEVTPAAVQAFVEMPLKDRMGHLVRHNADLFNDSALEFFGVATPPAASAAGPLVNWKDTALAVLRQAESGSPVLQRFLFVMEQIMGQGPPQHTIVLAPFNTDNTRMLSPYNDFRNHWAGRASSHYPLLKDFIGQFRKSCLATLTQPVIDAIHSLTQVRPDLMEVAFRQVLSVMPKAAGPVEMELHMALGDMTKILGLGDKNIVVVNMGGLAGDYLETRALPPGHAVREMYAKRLRAPKDQTIYLIEVGGGIHRKRWILRDKAHNDVSRRAGWTDRNALQLGRNWQHRAGLAHELVEMFFTKVGTRDETETNRLAVHNALLEIGIGIDVPQIYGAQAKRFFDTPIHVHIAELINKQPNLFNNAAKSWAASIATPAPESAPAPTDKSLDIEQELRNITDGVLQLLALKNITVRVNIDETNNDKRPPYMQEIKQPENKAIKTPSRVFEWWIRRDHLETEVHPRSAVKIVAKYFDGSTEKARTWLLQNRIAEELIAALGPKKKGNTIVPAKSQLREVLKTHGFGTTGFKAEHIRAPLLERIQTVVQARPDLFDPKMIRRFGKPKTEEATKFKLHAWTGADIGARLMELLQRNPVSLLEFQRQIQGLLALYAPTTLPGRLIADFLEGKIVYPLAQFLAIKVCPTWGDSWIGGKGKTLVDVLLSSLGYLDSSSPSSELRSRQRQIEARAAVIAAALTQVPIGTTVRLIENLGITDVDIVYANKSKREIVISLTALHHIRVHHGRELMAAFFAAARARQEKVDEKNYNEAYFQNLAETRLLAHELAHLAGVSEEMLRAHYLGPTVPTDSSPDEFRTADFYSEKGLIAKVNQLIAESNATARAKAARREDTSHGRGYPITGLDAWYGGNVGAQLLAHLILKTDQWPAFRKFLGSLVNTGVNKLNTTLGGTLIAEFLHVSSPNSGTSDPRTILDRLTKHFDGYFDDILSFDEKGENWEHAFLSSSHKTVLDKLLELIGATKDTSAEGLVVEKKLEEAAKEIQTLFPELTQGLLGDIYTVPDELSDFAFVFSTNKYKVIYYSAKEIARIQKEHGAALFAAYKEVVGTKKIKDEAAFLAEMERLALYKFLIHEALHGMGISENILRDHYLATNVPNKRSLDSFKDKNFFTLKGLIEEAKAVVRGRHNKPSLSHKEKIIPITFKKRTYPLTSSSSWENNEIYGADWSKPNITIVFPSNIPARVQSWELPEEPSNNVRSMAIDSPRRDGTIRVAIGHNDGHISIWELPIRQPSDEVFTRSKAGVRVVKLLPIPTKQVPARLVTRSFAEVHQAPVESLYFSFSGRELASGDGKGQLLFWDVEQGTVINRYQNSGPIDDVRLFENSALVIFSNPHAVFGWRPASGALVFKKVKDLNDDQRIITVDTESAQLGIFFVRDNISMGDEWDLRPIARGPIYTLQQFYPAYKNIRPDPMLAGTRFFHVIVRKLWKAIRTESPHAETKIRDAALHAPTPHSRRYTIARFLEEVLSVLQNDHQTTPGLRSEFRHEIKKGIRILRQAGRILVQPKEMDRHARRSKRDLVRSKKDKLPHLYALIDVIAEHFYPLFHGIPAVADKIQALAGFRKIEHSKPFGGLFLDQAAKDVLKKYFQTDMSVSVEVLSDSSGKIRNDFVFTEQISLEGGSRVVVYVAEKFLLDVLNQPSWDGKKDAFEFFLLRQLGHELLGLSFADLDNIGLTKQKPADAKPIPELVEAMKGLNPSKGMLALLKDNHTTDGVSDTVPQVLSYYGNDPLRILIEKTLKDPTHVAHSLNKLITGLKDLFDRVHEENLAPINGALSVLNKRLEELVAAQRYFTFPHLVTQVVVASSPLFQTSSIVADLIMSWAGLDFQGLGDYERKRRLEAAGQTFFDQYFKRERWTFQLEIRNGHNVYAGDDLIFVQTFVVRGLTRVVVRATESSLNGVLNQAEKIRQRAAAAGILLSVAEADKLAFQMVLVHEIGESVYDLSHEALVQAGIGGESGLFLSTEGLVGALMSLTKTGESRLVKNRKEELQLLGLLAPAHPILKQIFQQAGQAANYGAQFNAWTPRYNAEGQINPEDMMTINYYEPERHRLEALPVAFSRGARPAADVYQEANTANANTLMIFDQDGGYKDLADQYALYLADENRRNKGPFVVGVLEKESGFQNKVINYYGFISGGAYEPKTRPKAAALDIERAKKLLDDIRNPESAIKVVALPTEWEAGLEKLMDQKDVDVTAFVEYVKSEAVKLNPQIQKVVLISDWRRLMVGPALQAITTVIMNLNLFIHLEQRMELETVAAIQA